MSKTIFFTLSAKASFVTPVVPVAISVCAPFSVQKVVSIQKNSAGPIERLDWGVDGVTWTEFVSESSYQFTGQIRMIPVLNDRHCLTDRNTGVCFILEYQTQADGFIRKKFNLWPDRQGTLRLWDESNAKKVQSIEIEVNCSLELESVLFQY